MSNEYGGANGNKMQREETLKEKSKNQLVKK